MQIAVDEVDFGVVATSFASLEHTAFHALWFGESAVDVREVNRSYLSAGCNYRLAARMVFVFVA
jgi:hypothetical protein